MLPLTLIAGIYGMNLRLWPPPEHPLSFWGVIAMMLATTVGLLIYFGRKKWL
jgi:magnesium transporter